MQNRVGGASHGHGHGDCVLKGLLGQDIPGANVLFQEAHQGPAHVAGLAQLPGVDGRGGSVAGEGHAQYLNAGGHGVGGEQAAAGPLAGTGHAFQRGEFIQSHVALGVGAHGFKDVLNVHVLATELPGHDGPAVHEDGRDV